MSKKLVAGIVAVVVLVALYFGLTIYASGKAAEQVDAAIAKGGPAVHVSYTKVAYNILNKQTAISGVSILAPGSPTPVRVGEVLVRRLDETSPTPAFVAVDFKGIEVDLKSLGDDAAAAAALGYKDTLYCDLGIDYAYAKDKKDLDLKTLSLAVKDVGSLSVSLHLGNVDIDPNQAATLLFTYPQILLHQASVTYKDASLMERLLKAEAAKSGIDVATLKQNLSRDADEALQGQTNPLLAGALTAVKQFINNPKELSISASPAKPLPLGQIGNAATPDAVAAMLNIQIKS